jgi:hypothetical protein
MGEQAGIRFDRWCPRCALVMGKEHPEAQHDGHGVLDVPQLHALSLFDPWLWSIDALPADKAKRLENRPWPPYPWVRRQRWIAAHVTQKWDEGARHRIAQLSGEVPPSRDTAEMKARRSCITSMVRIDGFIYPADAQKDLGLGSIPLPVSPWWFRDQFGWIVGDVHTLKQPIEVSGRQKVWRVPVPAAVRVAEQLPPHIIAALAQPARTSVTTA